MYFFGKSDAYVLRTMSIEFFNFYDLKVFFCSHTIIHCSSLQSDVKILLKICAIFIYMYILNRKSDLIIEKKKETILNHIKQ